MSGQGQSSTKENLIFLGVLAGIGGAIGAITGCGLSFTALPILAIGAIIAAVPAMLFAAFCVYSSYKNGELTKKDVALSVGLCIAATAVGVGFAAAATAIFPGLILGMGSAAGIGALIGAVAPIAGIFVASLVMQPIVDKVSEWITSPEVEQTSPSKGSGAATPSPHA